MKSRVQIREIVVCDVMFAFVKYIAYFNGNPSKIDLT